MTDVEIPTCAGNIQERFKLAMAGRREKQPESRMLLNMLYTLLLFTPQGIPGECRSSG
jgi:hypothetical protein